MMFFKIEKKIKNALGRAAVLRTLHGEIETPAFVTVGTKATVKALTPEMVKAAGSQVVLANTYHLYLEPGEKIVAEAGGLHKFMNWPGPIMTDSGGFQVFSLGAAFGSGVNKFITLDAPEEELIKKAYGPNKTNRKKLMVVDDDGVSFRSHIDGGQHRFTPERSIEIQNQLGADIIFSFDECTSPHAGKEYLETSLDRTHNWAERSFRRFKELSKSKKEQYIFGIVQGGRFEDLRRRSAKFISGLDFDGFGLGGSFIKEDIETAIGWINQELPEEKPRHLLGVGEPIDLILAVENGADLFDCVLPTRMGRNGALFTASGKINIFNRKFSRDFKKLDDRCECYCCQNYTRAYLSHLFRSKEMLAATLASIHNLYFLNNLMSRIRESILEDKFFEFKEEFLSKYKT